MYPDYINEYIRSVQIHSSKFCHVSRYFVHPNAKEWFIKSDFQKTEQFPRYLENSITYAFLDKFGGTVLSFDYLLLRSITGLGESVGRCNDNWVEPQPLTSNSRHPLLYEFQVTMLVLQTIKYLYNFFYIIHKVNHNLVSAV